VTKSKFKEISYDVIDVTSPTHVTKLTTQNFSILGPSKAKFLATQMHCLL